MSRYVYVCYVKWRDRAKEKGRSFLTDTWLPHHREQCKKHGVKLLRWGLPMGTPEDHAFIYETDLDAASFMDFKGDASTLDGERLWDYSSTVTIVAQGQ